MSPPKKVANPIETTPSPLVVAGRESLLPPCTKKGSFTFHSVI
jgi:hypothetical protein